MFAEIWCTHCNRHLRVKQDVLGKKVRCPACTKVFVAEDIPTVEPVAPPAAAPARPAPPPLPRQLSTDPAAIAPQPLPAPRPVSVAANPLLPPTGPQRPRPVVTRADEKDPPADFPPVEYKATVKTDPDKKLKGVFTARVTSDGLQLRQGKKHDLQLPVGTPAQYLDGNRFLVEIDGREVTFTAMKFGAYQARLARDTVKFLAGRKRVLYREDYSLEWYLFIPAVLPLGIPILTLGGALPCALGFGLAGGCMAIAQLEYLGKGARIALSLLLGFVGYAIIIALLWAALSNRWGAGPRAEIQIPNVALPPPPAQQGWQNNAPPRMPPPNDWPQKQPPRLPMDPNGIGKPPQGPKIDFKILPKIEGNKEELKPVLNSRLLQFPGVKYLTARFSPDGKVLAISGDKKGVSFWDAATGKQLGSAPGQTVGDFTRDGKRVVLGDSLTVRQWDLAAGKVLPEALDGQGFALSNDGRRLIAFTAKDKNPSSPKTVRCYELASGKLEGTWQTPAGMMTGIGMAPDGRSLAMSFFIDRLEVHDAATGALRVRCQPQLLGGVFRPVYAPDGKTLASSAHGGAVVSLYDANTGQIMRTFEEPSRRPPWMLAFSPDGKKLAAGALNGVLRVWDVSTGKSLAELKVDDTADAGKPGLDHAIWDVQISPDGRYLVATASGLVRIWDAAPLLQVAANDIRLTGTLPPNPNFNPTREELARALPREAVRPEPTQEARQPPTKQPKEEVKPPPKEVVKLPSREKINPPREVVTLPPKEVVKPLPKEPATVTLAPTGTIRLPPNTSPKAVVFHPDGKTLVVGGGHGAMFWDLVRGIELARLQSERAQALAVALSSDGKRLAYVDVLRVVKVWDLEARRELHRFRPNRIVHRLQFLPGGHRLAIGNGGIVLKDMDNGEERRLVGPMPVFIDGLAVSPDGKRIACGTHKGDIHLCDVASGKVLGVLKAHRGAVFALTFSPDGKTLASGGSDRQIRLWNVATCAEVATLSGHVDPISSLVYTPDGKLLAAAAGGVRADPGRSGELKIWDVAGRRVTAELRGHTNGVTAVSVSPDGGKLVSVSRDNTLRLWDLTRVTIGAGN